jgi:esterase/lipase superfamily enzyme
LKVAEEVSLRRRNPIIIIVIHHELMFLFRWPKDASRRVSVSGRYADRAFSTSSLNSRFR